MCDIQQYYLRMQSRAPKDLQALCTLENLFRTLWLQKSKDPAALEFTSNLNFGPELRETYRIGEIVGKE